MSNRLIITIEHCITVTFVRTHTYSNARFALKKIKKKVLIIHVLRTRVYVGNELYTEIYFNYNALV